MTKRASRLAAVAFLLALPAAVLGVEVAPGKFADPNRTEYDGPLTSDELVVSRSTPFELTGVDQGTDTRRVFSGGFTTSVYRSRDDGTLSFLYRAGGRDTADRVVDGEGTSVTGFRTFRTDVQISDGFPFTPVSRSADGDMIRTGYDESVGHTLFIRTDATAFADGGEYRFSISFQPSGGDPSAVFPSFRPVPEPASLALVGCAALGLMRRRRATADSL